MKKTFQSLAAFFVVTLAAAGNLAAQTTVSGIIGSGPINLTGGSYTPPAQIPVGSSFLWWPSQGAFVSGNRTSTVDSTKIGANSFSFGDGASAQGANSFAFGAGAAAVGSGSFAFGSGARANGVGGVAIGATWFTDYIDTGDSWVQSSGAYGAYTFSAAGATAGGDYSVAMGQAAQTTAQGSIAIGNSVATSAIGQVALGTLNIGLRKDGSDPSQTIPNPGDPIFEIGNGVLNYPAWNLGNAFAVFRDGTVYMGNSVHTWVESGQGWVVTTTPPVAQIDGGAPGGTLVVAPSGKVGIGTTSPRAKEEILGPISAPTALANAVATGSLLLSNSNGNVGTVGTVMGTTLNGSSYDSYIQSRNMGAANTAYNLLLNPLGGNIGLGTTTPGYKLTVASGDINIDNGQAIRSGGDGLVSNNGANLIQLGSANVNHAVSLAAGGADRLHILTNGNVGIGLPNPQFRLDVAGDTHASGNLTIGGGVSSASLAVTSNATIGGALGVTGQTTAGSLAVNTTATVAGQLSAASANVTGNLSTGSATITNNLTVLPGGTATINGPATLQTANITGVSSYSGAMTFGPGANVGGTLNWGTTATDLLSLTAGAGRGLFLGVDASTLKGFTITPSGNVGIGTNTPDQKLHIFGGSLQIGDLNSVAGIRLIIDAGGNIVHTYGPNNGSDTVGNHGRFEISNNAGEFGFDSGTDSGSVALRANGGGWSAVTGGPSLRFLTNGTSTNQTYNANTAQLRMVIDSTGNVGIGTPSPVARLDVGGTGNSDISLMTDSIGISMNNGGSNGIYFGQDHTANPTTGSYGIRFTSGQGFDWMWSGTPAIRVGSGPNGYVGIGTTSPQSRLDVAGDVNAGGVYWSGYYAKGPGGETATLRVAPPGYYSAAAVGFAGTDTNTPFAIRTNGNPSAWFSANGNVGIGTTNPQFRLDVAGNANIQGNVSTSGNLAAASANIQGNLAATGSITASGNIAASGTIAAAAMTGAGGASNLTLNPNGGSVGIGTTNPKAKLDVAGGVSIGSGQGEQLTLQKGGDIVILDSQSIGLNGYTPKYCLFMDGGFAHIRADLNQDVDSAAKFQLDATGGIYLNPSQGKVGIGTTNPDRLLTVNGTIHAKEILVDTAISANDLKVQPKAWADNVFDAGYRNAPLSDVEAAIKAQGHLPGIPSAKEVAEKGVSVGEMQAKLLSKVEELTLHLIAQEKRIERLESENAALRAR